ncbi:hypothetical protein NDU88_007143 [Pleurodeles waltl]|uniref:Uncharacterized protein n=1 Tax=Pleurodeles waltl TaxID=8319 RepID=A0AAV7SRV6_PLEWA|nr:hypothetical protein NDU88_007143 [Pleurodeles waltl]
MSCEAPLLAAAATPDRSARPVPDYLRGEGWLLTAGRRSRAWPQCFWRPPPVGAQGEIPRSGSPQVSARTLQPRLGAVNTGGPALGPGAGAPEVRSRGGAPTRARQLRGERCPGNTPRALHSGREPRPSSTHPSAHGPPSRATDRSGAAPPPRRLNPDFTVTSRGTQMGPPRCRVCTAPTSARPVCFPAQVADRASLHLTRRTNSGPAATGPSLSGHPRVGGGSHHIVVPARDQDKRTKGGP